MENIKIGYIGLGCRGKDLLENIVLAQKEQVVAVCDVYEDRAREDHFRFLTQKSMNILRPFHLTIR